MTLHGSRVSCFLYCLCSLVALGGCDGTVTDPPLRLPPESLSVELVEVASGLSLPVYLTAPAGDSRLFVVEKPGRVRVVDAGGQLLPVPFLDVASLVSNGGEQGLLSLAFDPDFGTNGRFYISYTNQAGDTRVVRYRVSADPDRADPATAEVILAVDQPYANHNGGLVTFGPDGMLYVGLGDGGSAGDPDDNGQNLGTLLGKLLRIDVSSGGYAVPPDNPFLSEPGARGEIWAFGLRNPWRFSFDSVDDRVYVADVGQNAWEEVNAEPAGQGGLNYGWRLMEGGSCFRPSSCTTTGLVLPVVEYANGADGCAVVGGYVYRGGAIAGLAGTYFYSDNCAGWVRSFRLVDGRAEEQTEWALGSVGNVLSFGEDAAGELYVLTASGTVYRLAPSR